MLKPNLKPKLKKRFGQNHLISGHLCRPLVEFLAPEDQRILEIGPGGGVLTSELLDAGAQVWACEIDLEWLFHLRGRLREPLANDDLRLLALDALALDPARLPPETLVAGNLPFNVATPIIERLLPCRANVPRMAFMVQKEVGERLVAGPKDRAYGSLSVLVKAWAKARLLGRISPRSFRPPPKVEAVFVGFALHDPPLPAEEMPAWTRFVRQCFAQRRKTLRNNLSTLWGKEFTQKVLDDLNIDPKCRAEQLGIETFVELFSASPGSSHQGR